MGVVSPDACLGLVLWARRPLGRGFLLTIAISQIISGQKPFVLIDDLLPRAMFRRSVKEQETINEMYRNFMVGAGCRIEFISQLFSSNSYLFQVARMLGDITYREFIRCLPSQKKDPETFKILTVSEIMHVAAELFLFEQIKEFGVDTIIIPKFAQAIIALHRNISVVPLKAVITTKFGDIDEIERGIVELENNVLTESHSISFEIS